MYRVQFKHGAVEKEFDLDKEGAFDAARAFLQDRTLLGGPVEIREPDCYDQSFRDNVRVVHSYLETIEMNDENDFDIARYLGHAIGPMHLCGTGLPAIAKYVEPGVRYTSTYLWDNLCTVMDEHEHLIAPLYHCTDIPDGFMLLDRSDPKLEYADYYRVYRRGARSLVLVYCGDCCGEDCVFIVQFDPV